MRIGDWLGGFLDEVGLEREVDQQAVDARKLGADEGKLASISQGRSVLPVIKAPPVRRLSDDRLSRRQGEEEMRRRQQMLWAGERTVAANQAMLAVAVHTYQQLDAAQEAMMSSYLGVKRTDTGNKFMAQVTNELLTFVKAGAMAMVESLPKRLAEEM